MFLKFSIFLSIALICYYFVGQIIWESDRYTGYHLSNTIQSSIFLNKISESSIEILFQNLLLRNNNNTQFTYLLDLWNLIKKKKDFELA